MNKAKFFRDNAATFIIDIAETMDDFCLWAEIVSGEHEGDTYASLVVRDLEAGSTKTITRDMILKALKKLSFDDLDRIENHDYDWRLADKVLQLAYHRKVIYG